MTTSSPHLESSNSSDISHYQHTPFYCEENVYFLCKKLCANGIADSDGSDLFVAFISNEKKQVPLWRQKASHRADGAVLWDYHVICIQKKPGGRSAVPLVWDLDSNLPFPSPLTTYITETTRPSFSLFSEFERFFRIVHAPTFLQFFATDRRHMKDSTGHWISEPPKYDPITAEDGTVHNLNEYMEMQSADEASYTRSDLVNAGLTKKLGLVLGESHLEEFFSVES